MISHFFTPPSVSFLSPTPSPGSPDPHFRRRCRCSWDSPVRPGPRRCGCAFPRSRMALSQVRFRVLQQFQFCRNAHDQSPPEYCAGYQSVKSAHRLFSDGIRVQRDFLVCNNNLLYLIITFIFCIICTLIESLLSFYHICPYRQRTDRVLVSAPSHPVSDTVY